MKTEMDRMCERYQITAEWTEGPTHQVDDEGWEHHGGKVRIIHRHPGGTTRQMTIPYRMGMALNPDEMRPADVVSSVALDASLGVHGFDDFCSELGYDADTDSRKALASWRASWRECRRSAQRFERFCTSQAMLDDLTDAEH